MNQSLNLNLKRTIIRPENRSEADESEQSILTNQVNDNNIENPSHTNRNHMNNSINFENSLNYTCREGWLFPYTIQGPAIPITYERTAMWVNNEFLISEKGKAIERGQLAVDYVFDLLREKVGDYEEEFTFSEVGGVFRLYRKHKFYAEGEKALIRYNELIARI